LVEASHITMLFIASATFLKEEGSSILYDCRNIKFKEFPLTFTATVSKPLYFVEVSADTTVEATNTGLQLESNAFSSETLL
jgi:hypothetical protein